MNHDYIINQALAGLQTSNENMALKQQNADLKAEVERLNHLVNYWKIEAECDHGRWLRCLEDLEKLRSIK